MSTQRIPKYVKEYNVQGYYGGWEDVTAEDNRKEARQRLREYRENDPQHAYRLITRRVPNPAYIAPSA